MEAIAEVDLDQRDEQRQNPPQRYRCWLRSVSGMHARHEGYVDVWSRSADQRELLRLAVAQLRRASFSARSIDMWRLTGVDLLVH